MKKNLWWTIRQNFFNFHLLSMLHSNVSYVMEFFCLMGPKKQGFCSKINCIQMKLLYFVNWHSARVSESAKIVLSKSIFYVINQQKKSSQGFVFYGVPFDLCRFCTFLNLAQPASWAEFKNVQNMHKSNVTPL